MKNIQSVLKTYEAVARLAQVLRHNNTTFNTNRRENVAEHSYSLTVLAAAVASDLNTTGENLDIGRVVQFASVHDLVEAYMPEGDISVYAAPDLVKDKAQSEKQAFKKLAAKVDHAWITDTITQYDSQNTPEARFVYALDKLVVHMHVIIGDHHHARPRFADYLNTERIARQKIERSYKKLLLYFDELCNTFRERPHFFKDAPFYKGR